MAVPGFYRVEAELMHAVCITTNELDMIGNARSLPEGGRLKHAHKNYGGFREHMLRKGVFAGKLLPIEIRFFHELTCVLIPIRDFQAEDVCRRQNFRNLHGHRKGVESSLFAIEHAVRSGKENEFCTKKKNGGA